MPKIKFTIFSTIFKTRSSAVAELADRTAYDALIYDQLDN